MNAPDAPGATWGPNDLFVFAAGNRAGLSLGSVTGGGSRSLTSLDAQAGEASHRWPELLPDGRAVIFTAGPPSLGDWHDSNIVAQSLDTGERHVLVRGAAQAHYVRTGHLVYARASTLFAVPFDVSTLRVSGTPVAVLEGVREDQSLGSAQFAVSANGTLVFVPGGLSSSEMMWVDRRGRAEPFMVQQQPRFFHQPRLSPDGRHLAVIVASGNDDIWLYDLSQDVLSRFTSGANHRGPNWTPDGTRISYLRTNTRDILWQTVDSSGSPESLTKGTQSILHSWSPDGRLAALTDVGQATRSDVWIFDLESRQRRALLQTSFAEVTPMISPDGRWLAYASDESGRFQVYVVPFPGGGGKQQVSRDGGLEPVWARNSQELFFRQGNKLMAATVGNGRFGRPEELFEFPTWLDALTLRSNYDVALDGRRFALISVPHAPATSINVVLNWAEELKRLVP